jgi:eukaryotic-like serine/threonine-protein kinase
MSVRANVPHSEVFMSTPTLDEAAIFNTARCMAALEERRRYVREACAEDPALLARIEAMLELHAKEPGYLETDIDGMVGVLDEPPLAEPGMQLGPYKLIRRIGEGGMGTVFMAEQVLPVKRQVAVKIIKSGMDSRRVLARFEAERQALALMDHPNIAKVLDVGATGAPEPQSSSAVKRTAASSSWSALKSPDSISQPYFVMELVQGVPITHYCDEHCLTPKERLELFIPICYAVQHAHQKGIIHRDLKPSNVLVTVYDDQRVPKIIDFGVAKAVGDGASERARVTEFGSVIGTLEYMSPEQAEPGQPDIDTRSDIYSLGALLYELLTGTTPLQPKRLSGAAMLELLRLVREEEPPSPSSRLSTTEELPSIAANRRLEPRQLSGLVRGDLDWIVMKCLEKTRTRRYQTASELARDLDRYLHDEAVEARPPTRAYRFRKFAWRNRRLLATGVAFFTLLVIGAAVSAWQAIRATAAERLARENAQHARSERDLVVVEKQRADEKTAITKAVNEFLQVELLGQADIGNQDPGSDRNRNISVRELLDRAAQRIGPKFKGQELTEAAIRLTLGKAYLALAEFAAARTQLEISLILRKDKLGLASLDALESTNALGVACLESKQYEQAEPLLKQALVGFRQMQGAQHVDTLMAMQNLAVLCNHVGHFEEAEHLFKEALPGLESQLGIDHRETLATMGNLAGLYHSRGRDDKAEPLLREVLNRRRAKLGKDHPDTIGNIEDLADIERVRGKLDEAELLYKQALQLRRAKLGEDHPGTLESMNGLAMLYRDRSRYDLAEPLLKQVLEAKRKKLGADHPDTVAVLNNLAALYRDQGRFAEAEPLFKQVLESWRARLGADHPRTLRAMNNLATLYLSRQRFDEAEPLLVEAVRLSRAKLGTDHPATLQTVYNLGGLYMERARYQDAEPQFRQVYESRRFKLGDDHPDTIASLNSLALVQNAEGNYQSAEPIFRQVLEMRRAKLGPDHVDTIRSMNNLALLYRDRGRLHEANQLLDEAVAHATKRLGLSHPQTQRTILNQAEVLSKMSKPELAEPRLRELAAFLRDTPGSTDLAYAHQLERLAENLLEQKKYADSAVTIRECFAIVGEREPERWTTFRVQSLLGAALLGEGKYVEAESMLLQGYEGLKLHERKIPNDARFQLYHSLEWICHLYEAWGKPEQAGEWKKKLAAYETRWLQHAMTLARPYF